MTIRAERYSSRPTCGPSVAHSGSEPVPYQDMYDRLTEEGYDDSSWSAEELDRLREESADLLERYGNDACK